MFKIALCQTKVFNDKEKSLKNAMARISEAAQNGANIIALPEMFNCPYSGKNFSKYGENEGNSYTLNVLKQICIKENIYLIAGSIPEIENGKTYNTSYTIAPSGKIVGKHRKIHLFDVDIKNGVRFFESKYLSRGDSVTVFETDYCKIGICICYDIRFPELIRKMVLQGVNLIFVPAAFSITTGLAHWELLFRTRAIDNQIYIAGISPARDCEGNYKPYGNSIIVSPYGEIISRAGEADEIIYGDIDLAYEENTRKEMPLLKHRIPKLY